MIMEQDKRRLRRTKLLLVLLPGLVSGLRPTPSLLAMLPRSVGYGFEAHSTTVWHATKVSWLGVRDPLCHVCQQRLVSVPESIFIAKAKHQAPSTKQRAKVKASERVSERGWIRVMNMMRMMRIWIFTIGKGLGCFLLRHSPLSLPCASSFSLSPSPVLL